MKKILTIVMAALIFIIPNISSVSAATNEPYLENEKFKELPKKTLVPSRTAIVKSGAPTVGGLLAGMLQSYALSTPVGQQAYEQGIEALTVVDKAAEDFADGFLAYNYNSAVPSDFEVSARDFSGLIGFFELAYERYLNRAWGVYTGQVITPYLRLRAFDSNIVPENDNYLRLLEKDGDSTLYTFMYHLKRNDEDYNFVYGIETRVHPAVGLEYFPIKYYYGTDFTYITPTYKEDLWTVPGYQGQVKTLQNAARVLRNVWLSDKAAIAGTYTDTVSAPSVPILNSTSSTYSIPMIPNYVEDKKIPAVVQIGETDYWEIPYDNANYDSTKPEDENNPKEINNYVPVDDPKATPEPEKIPNPDYDPTKPINPSPDDAANEWDWWKALDLLGWFGKMVDALIDIPLAIIKGITDIISSLFVPTVPLSETFAPMFDSFKAKFNTPEDFDYLKGSFDTTGNSCTIADMNASFFGHEMKVFDGKALLDTSTWFKPIMAGFMWLLFGFWAFRKVNAIVSKNGGIN